MLWRRWQVRCQGQVLIVFVLHERESLSEIHNLEVKMVPVESWETRDVCMFLGLCISSSTSIVSHAGRGIEQESLKSIASYISFTLGGVLGREATDPSFPRLLATECLFLGL